MSTMMELQQLPLWEKLIKKRIPLAFNLEITARCNNDCRHCYINLPAGDRAAQVQELTLSEIEHIADQAVAMGAMWCLITGGEPLLRPDFPEIYLALKRKGLLVSVFTNGCLVTNELVTLFKKFPPRDIEVTVYGATRETYEAVTRTHGSYAAFVRGLDRLLASEVRTRLKAMALRANLHEMDEISRFCRERTKDYYRFDPVLHLRYDGNSVRNREICSQRLAPSEIATLEKTDPERVDALEHRGRVPINPEYVSGEDDHLFLCGAGLGSFDVSYDGKFRLCSSLWAAGTTYNLREGTLADAWNNLVPKVRDLRSQRHAFLTTCCVCPIIDLCLWCPAHAHLETGQLDGEIPYFCAVAHARAEIINR